VTPTTPSDVAGATLTTRSAAETQELGRALATVARPGDRIALLGDLGTGKTQLAKGFAAGLGVAEVVVSPTFILSAEYEGRLALFHQDRYRLTDADEAWEGGLDDPRTRAGVTLVEWADRTGPDPDPMRAQIRISSGTGDERMIEVGPVSSPVGRRYAAAASAWERSVATRPGTAPPLRETTG
jgi:tRNA threonylcarbamoyladenosine biosynthesis protein TsaE